METVLSIAYVSALTWAVTGKLNKLIEKYAWHDYVTPLFAIVLSTFLWMYANDFSLAPEIVLEGLGIGAGVTGTVATLKK